MSTKKKPDIMKHRAKPSGGFARFMKWVIGLIFLCGLMGGAGAVLFFFHLSEDLPKISSLSDYRPAIITAVYSDDNRKIGEFYKERRVVIPVVEMPKHLLEAFIAAEDSRFYTHKGIDLVGILRAVFKNIEAGGIVQGGSTITQQVTKSLLLTPERSFERKFKEAILAYRIDQALSKEEVLYLYLNQIYLGHGAYGVEAASENYFGKSARDLSLPECALLAGLPQAPSRYSPLKNWELAKQRQLYVLSRMAAEGYISDAQAATAGSTPVDLKPKKNWFIEEVPDYTEYVRQYVEKKYGEAALTTGGLQIYTTVNVDMQRSAVAQMQKGLRELDKRQGYRGPARRIFSSEIDSFLATADSPPPEIEAILPGVVTALNRDGVSVRLATAKGILPFSEMQWARKADLRVGDVVEVKLISQTPDGVWHLSLDQTPLVQGSLLCIEAGTGMVKAMVGGRDFTKSQFNRAIQSRRQPGSAFKPIVYLAAFENGFTPASVLVDSPLVFADADTNLKWKPENYEETYNGPTLLRDALAHSLNIISIKLLQEVGVGKTIEYARKLGITAPLEPNLSIALGSSDVSLFELTAAYSVFDNGGELVSPVFITKILDRDGKVLEENIPNRKEVIDPATAYLMTSMLESVVTSGTGQRIRALNRPAAGKTGTTNDLFDAWFVGFTPEYITGTWVGFDEKQSLGGGETGARAAAPIWLGFMQEVLQAKPVRDFPVPEGVVFVKIDAETGLLPGPDTRQTRFEVFKEGTAPTEATQPQGTTVDRDEFFKQDM